MRRGVNQIFLGGAFALVAVLAGCASAAPSKVASAPARPATPVAVAQPAPQVPLPPPAPAPLPPDRMYPIMLGIDTLEASGFAALRGKRVGLLSHQAGVNRRGESTVDVLRRASSVTKLVALYSAEHGFDGTAAASVKVGNSTDRRTGLPVISLYPQQRPNKDMLKNIDVMVIDLQDIGTRSYTYVSAMKWTMEGCFQNNIEVVVLDRPNPLGGLKVDGPPLDERWSKNNYVGAFRVPYVHGMTIGELARMAKEAPGVLEVADAVRAKGKLTVIPMRGWTRAMRWSDTGLKFVPTSPQIRDLEAVQGYPMTGLGSYFETVTRYNFDIGFRTGVGAQHPFRGLSFKNVRPEVLEKELAAIAPKLRGVKLLRVAAPTRDGKPGTGIYIQITDHNAWQPTELNFWMMKIACKLSPQNPFAIIKGREFSGFLRHMGSQEFLNDIAAKGAAVDIDAWLAKWRAQARISQEQSKKYWLYQ